MRRSLALAVATLAAAFAPFVPSHSVHAKGTPRTETFHWTGAVTAGETFIVNGVNGSIELEPSSDNTVVVDAVKKGRRSSPTSVQIDVRQDKGRTVVCAVYPGMRCSPDGTLSGSNRNNDVTVAFTIHVPAGVRVRARTVNGSVTSHARTPDIEARSVNGSVELETTGRGVGHTVNGNVDVVVNAARLSDDLECNAVNGNVRLRLPHKTDADVEIETVHGRIDVDFPMNDLRRSSHTEHLDGRIGNGGHQVMCKTVNGSVSVSPNGV